MLENFFNPERQRRAMFYLNVVGFLTVLLLRSSEMSKQDSLASAVDLKGCELFHFVGSHAETVGNLLKVQETLSQEDLAKLSPEGVRILAATLQHHPKNPQTFFSECPDVGLSRLSSSDQAAVGLAVLAQQSSCKPF